MRRPLSAVPLLTVVYALALTWIYQRQIAPRFAYIGFVNLGASAQELIAFAALCGVLSLVVPWSVRQPSDLAAIMIFLIVVIPSIMVPSLLARTPSDTWGFRIETMVGFGIFLIARRSLAFWRPRPYAIRPRSFNRVLLGLALGSASIIALRFGVGISLHGLSTIYDVRNEFKSTVSDAGYIRYCTGVLLNVVSPILITRGLVVRSKISLAGGILAALYVFSVVALKSAFASVFFVVAIYLIIKRIGDEFMKISLGALVTLIGAGSALANAPVGSLISDLVVRRVLIIQGVLGFSYHRIFASYQSSWLSHSILAPLFTAPRVVDPPGIVGEELFHRRGTHANVNLFSDGYVNGKLLGIVIFAACAGLFFAALDAVSRGLPPSMSVPSVSMVTMAAVQSGFVVVLGVHGGLVMLPVLYLYFSAHRSRRELGRASHEIVGAAPAASPSFAPDRGGGSR